MGEDRERTLERLRKTLQFYRTPPSLPSLPDGNDSKESRERHGVFINVFRQVMSKGAVSEWLEAGKQKQLEFIAKCHADPKWREMAERLGAYRSSTKIAKDQGWIEKKETPEDPF